MNITCAFIEKDGIIKGGFFRNICNNATYMLSASSYKLNCWRNYSRSKFMNIHLTWTTNKQANQNKNQQKDDKSLK